MPDMAYQNLVGTRETGAQHGTLSEWGTRGTPGGLHLSYHGDPGKHLLCLLKDEKMNSITTPSQRDFPDLKATLPLMGH